MIVLKIDTILFHMTIGICLSAIAIVAMCLGERTIGATAVGLLGGYVLKNGVIDK